MTECPELTIEELLDKLNKHQQTNKQQQTNNNKKHHHKKGGGGGGVEMLNTKELVKKWIMFRTLACIRNNKQFCARFTDLYDLH